MSFVSLTSSSRSSWQVISEAMSFSALRALARTEGGREASKKSTVSSHGHLRTMLGLFTIAGVALTSVFSVASSLERGISSRGGGDPGSEVMSELLSLGSVSKSPSLLFGGQPIGIGVYSYTRVEPSDLCTILRR